MNNYSKGSMYKIMCYSKKFTHVLHDGDAQELLSLSVQKRLLVMQSLATMSKYLGCYEQWKSIRQRYQLKWSSTDGLKILTNIANNKNNYSTMINWIKDTYAKIPKSYGNILIYCTLTGLRPSESCESISLIHKDLDNYLKKDSMILEHYKYPNSFIRKTKKAFISLVNDSILDVAKQAYPHSYNSIRLLIERNHKIPMHMAFCRKVFATYLRVNGIEQELIDLLQGRTPASVFARHYYRPDFDYGKIKQLLLKLHHEIVN
ncbi:MAG: hypothetical protein KGI19_08810 [Thaumarchaeota archaeon]|nr:hypothetical protein [Nitrososphaerota archaeon]